MCEQAIYFLLPSSRPCHWELLLFLVKSCSTRLCVVLLQTVKAVKKRVEDEIRPLSLILRAELIWKNPALFFSLLYCSPGPRGVLGIWSNKYETFVCVNCFFFCVCVLIFNSWYKCLFCLVLIIVYIHNGPLFQRPSKCEPNALLISNHTIKLCFIWQSKMLNANLPLSALDLNAMIYSYLNKVVAHCLSRYLNLKLLPDR